MDSQCDKLVGQWIVGVISFQKIFGLYSLNIILWTKGRMSHLWTDAQNVKIKQELD